MRHCYTTHPKQKKILAKNEQLKVPINASERFFEYAPLNLLLNLFHLADTRCNTIRTISPHTNEDDLLQFILKIDFRYPKSGRSVTEIKFMLRRRRNCPARVSAYFTGVFNIREDPSNFTQNNRRICEKYIRLHRTN